MTRALIALACAGLSCNKAPLSDDVSPLPGGGFPGAIGSASVAVLPPSGPGADASAGDDAAAAAGPAAPATGTGGSAGLAPGNPPDAGSDGPVAAVGGDAAAVIPAACPGNATCFDFEDGTAGQPAGGVWSGRGTVDGTRTFTGRNALHVKAGGDDAFATMSAPVFPVANNEYFGRVMAWTADVPGDHWTFIRSRGKSAEKGFAAEYTYGGQGKKIIANYDTPGGPSSDCWKNGGEFPVARWVCMEWHFKGATNELELWIDGVADAAHVISEGDGCMGNGTGKVWYAPTFSNIQLGYAVYGGGPGGRSVWFDDLAISPSGRLGCPAAP